MSKKNKQGIKHTLKHRYDNDLLEKLISIPSPSGSEAELTRYIIGYIKKHTKDNENASVDFDTDALGNLRATTYTAYSRAWHPTIAFDAHLDEISLMVMRIDDAGFIHVAPQGGVDPVYVPGMRFALHAKSGDLTAIVARNAIKFLSGEQEKTTSPIPELVLDVCMPVNKVRKLISVGDTLTYDVGLVNVSGKRIVSRALDNKLGLYIGIKAFLEINERQDRGDTTLPNFSLHFSVQEEIGCRGAIANTFASKADAVIVHDVTHALDYPGGYSGYTAIKLGAGPSISTGPNINPIVRDILVNAAEKNGIPYQLEPRAGMASNDAREVYVSRGGIPTGLISVPLRYMHSPNEECAVKDIEGAVDLVVAAMSQVRERQEFLPVPVDEES